MCKYIKETDRVRSVIGSKRWGGGVRRGEVVNQSASAGAMGVGRQVMSACDGWQLMSCERMRRKADAKRQHISVLRRLVCVMGCAL